MTVNDLTDAQLADIDKAFEAMPQIVDLRWRYNNLMKSFRIVEAQRIGRQIQQLRNAVLQEVVKEYNEGGKRLQLTECGLPKEDLEKVNTLVLTMYLIIDVFNSLARDVDDLLRKTDKGYELSVFDDLKEIIAQTDQKIRSLNEDTTYLKDFAFTDASDNLYNLAVNKAKAVIRKKGSPTWGENMRKFDERSKQLDQEYKRTHKDA